MSYFCVIRYFAEITIFTSSKCYYAVIHCSILKNRCIFIQKELFIFTLFQGDDPLTVLNIMTQGAMWKKFTTSLQFQQKITGIYHVHVYLRIKWFQIIFLDLVSFGTHGKQSYVKKKKKKYHSKFITNCA